jgi:hypothetical protein
MLNINNKRIDHLTNSGEPLEVRISIFTDGSNRLDDVLDLYQNRINVIDLPLDNPRDLPLACRDQLIKNKSNSDLLIYMEDDVIIHDKLFSTNNSGSKKKQTINSASCLIDMSASIRAQWKP